MPAYSHPTTAQPAVVPARLTADHRRERRLLRARGRLLVALYAGLRLDAPDAFARLSELERLIEDCAARYRALGVE